MKWFRNLKIGVKVLIICVLFICLMGGISMQGIFSMNNASEDFGKFYAQRFRPVRDLNHMLENYLQIKINLTTEMLDASIGNWKDIENRRADTKEQVKEYTSKWKEFNNKGLDANEKRMSDELMKIVLSTKKYRAKMEKAKPHLPRSLPAGWITWVILN